jgi:16S rRNA G1207 methylase RsmC
MPIDTDAFYHKTIDFRFWKQDLKFRTSQQLFSAHAIDAGSKFLLRTLVETAYPPPSRILDVGCGYGPLGLTLKSLHPTSLIHLFDRDALAVEYSTQNAELNGFKDIEIYGSLGYDDVKRNDFDLIVSNIPDHACEKVITCLLQEARCYLAPGGIVAIVVVTPLEEMVSKILSETPGAQVILKRSQSRHVVFHYRFADVKTPPPPARNSLDRGIYRRNDITMRYEKLEYTMQTAAGLPEFDSLSYGTEMLLGALGAVGKRDIKNAAVFNPGQGHVAVALWKTLKPQSITLIDRDLLALRYSRLNLTLNEYPPERISLLHQAGLVINTKEQLDLFIGVLRDDEPREVHILVLDQMAQRLAPNGTIILSSGSTPITRLADYVQSQKTLRIKSRERRRGFSLLLLEHIK